MSFLFMTNSTFFSPFLFAHCLVFSLNHLWNTKFLNWPLGLAGYIGCLYTLLFSEPGILLSMTVCFWSGHGGTKSHLASCQKCSSFQGGYILHLSFMIINGEHTHGGALHHSSSVSSKGRSSGLAPMSPSGHMITGECIHMTSYQRSRTFFDPYHNENFLTIFVVKIQPHTTNVKVIIVAQEYASPHTAHSNVISIQQSELAMGIIHTRQLRRLSSKHNS